MIDQQINLTWLRTFEAASRHLNFTQASKELHLTQAAVSLHIRSLEERLGRKLFHRNARHLALTELGQAYLPTVRQSLADINLVTATLFGQMTSKLVTIKLPVSVATRWLSPRLPSFRREYPDIDLRVISNIWMVSTGVEDVDIELRFGRGDWTDAPSEKMADETITPICSMEQKQYIRSPKDFLPGPFIHVLGNEGNWDRYLTVNGLNMPADTQRYFVDTSTAAIELVAAGGGFAALVTRFVDQPTTLSRIVPAGAAVPIPDSHYLMHHEFKQGRRPEVELFENWVREQFAQ